MSELAVLLKPDNSELAIVNSDDIDPQFFRELEELGVEIEQQETSFCG